MDLTLNESNLNVNLVIDMLSDLILTFLKKEAKLVHPKHYNIIMFRKPSKLFKMSRLSYFDMKEIIQIEEAEMFEYLDTELTLEALRDECA